MLKAAMDKVPVHSWYNSVVKSKQQTKSSQLAMSISDVAASVHQQHEERGRRKQRNWGAILCQDEAVTRQLLLRQSPLAPRITLPTSAVRIRPRQDQCPLSN